MPVRSWRQLAPLAAAAAALGFGVASCGGSKKQTPGSPAPTPSVTTTSRAPAATHRTAPLSSMFEDQAQLFSNPGGTLDTLRGLGVSTVRIYMAWGSVAPSPTSRSQPSGFDPTSPSAYPATAWQPYDAVAKAASSRGIGLMITLEGPPPLWAAGPGSPAGTPNGGADWKPSPGAFGSFVHAVAERYSGHFTAPGESSPLPRVSQWSIWNEPNYGPQLAPQATSDQIEIAPAVYRGLVGSAWTALHDSGHGHDTILIGELAPRGITGGNYPGNFSGMVPLRFLRALYCVDGSLKPLQGSAATARGCPPSGSATGFATQNPGLFQSTGLALHPYPQGAVAPTFVTPGEPDYADLAALPKVETLMDRLFATYGVHTRIPIYSTEFGYKTNPPYALGAPMAKAAAYLNWSEYISWHDPRVRTFDQYLLIDPPTDSGSKFVTGLEFAAGTPKPIYDAWRMPLYLPQTTVQKGLPLEVWGCVRPVAYASGTVPPAQIQFRAGSGGAFRTVRAVHVKPSDCYFDVTLQLPSSGTVQVSWSPPGGQTYHSRQVQVTGS